MGDQYDGIKLADMALVTVSYGQMSYQSITEERAVDLVDVVGKVLSAEMVTFIIFANDSRPFFTQSIPVISMFVFQNAAFQGPGCKFWPKCPFTLVLATICVDELILSCLG